MAFHFNPEDRNGRFALINNMHIHRNNVSNISATLNTQDKSHLNKKPSSISTSHQEKMGVDVYAEVKQARSRSQTVVSNIDNKIPKSLTSRPIKTPRCYDISADYRYSTTNTRRNSVFLTPSNSRPSSARPTSARSNTSYSSSSSRKIEINNNNSSNIPNKNQNQNQKEEDDERQGNDANKKPYAKFRDKVIAVAIREGIDNLNDLNELIQKAIVINCHLSKQRLLNEAEVIRKELGLQD